MQGVVNGIECTAICCQLPRSDKSCYDFPMTTTSSPAPIGIISALRDELSAVLLRMPPESRQRIANRSFRQCHWHGQQVVAVLSRIGKVAAATTATAMIERYGVRAIVFTGVAGGLGEGVQVGDLVVARSFLQHDLNASPLFARHEVPLYGLTRFRTDTPLSDTLAAAARQALSEPVGLLGAQAMQDFGLHTPQVHEGLILSGDQFINTAQDSVRLVAELPDALAVEMEGAAVAQVCHDYGVPFAAMRTISDRADDNAHVDFPRFTEQVASHYSAAVLDTLLAQLPA